MLLGKKEKSPWVGSDPANVRGKSHFTEAVSSVKHRGVSARL